MFIKTKMFRRLLFLNCKSDGSGSEGYVIYEDRQIEEQVWSFAGRRDREWNRLAASSA